MKSLKKITLSIMCLACCVITSISNAFGAGLLIADGGFGGKLKIVEHDVKVTINNGIAVTDVTQVFQNLVSNAIKFIDKPEGKITIGCTDEGTHWRFSVADNGPGIEEKHYDRIFLLFQTLAAGDDSESTGVGLALVKRIVETSGGRVWVESTVGEGSTFYFTLPKMTGEEHEKH